MAAALKAVNAKRRSSRYDDVDDDEYEGNWRRYEVCEYKLPIPEFVLSKAVQIAEKIPEAEFFVEQLDIQRKDPDPFLVVKVGREEYYIEVWDEPKFEANL